MDDFDHEGIKDKDRKPETVSPDEVSEFDLHPDVRKEYEHEMFGDSDYPENTHANPEEEKVLDKIDIKKADADKLWAKFAYPKGVSPDEEALLSRGCLCQDVVDGWSSNEDCLPGCPNYMDESDEALFGQTKTDVEEGNDYLRKIQKMVNHVEMENKYDPSDSGSYTKIR